jgi:ABC-2 type transport system ATP-binding protein
MNVIETENLTKIYQDNYIALNNMNLKVPAGAVFGLVGPNGAGKSTTIRLLLGLHTPTAGSVKVFGEPMDASAVHLRRRIGFLPTNPRFPQGMNPIAYLDFVGKLSSMPSEIRKPRLAALLRAVGLLSAASQKVDGFSTGMVTRLGIAASLMNDPELLIWDEPTSGLDPEGRKYTIDLIRELGHQKTIVVSSHNLGDIKQVCTHIGIVSEGQLIYSGPIAEMKQLTRSDIIALELSGDLTPLLQRLRQERPDLHIELRGQTLEMTFPDATQIATQLAAVLKLVSETGVALVGIHSLHDDMVDAFIHLLQEERSHGFSRLFRENA